MTDNKIKTSISTIENQIFELEGIRVVFRVSGQTKVNGTGYAFEKRMAKNSTGEALAKRLHKTFKAAGLDVPPYVVVLGDGSVLTPSGYYNVSTVAKSYQGRA